MVTLKGIDEELVKAQLKRAQNMAGLALWELNSQEDIKVYFRVDEKISPAKFKSDPLVPGGYLANSLTLRAMKPLLFVAGQDLDELADIQHCACGEEWDLQFWKFCPFCARMA